MKTQPQSRMIKTRRRISPQTSPAALPVVKMSAIRAYCDLIANTFKPQKVILFGSHATGKATPDSDVDLFVIMPFKGKAPHQAIAIRQRFHAPFPMDLLVSTPATVRRRLKQGDFFIREIVTRGTVLYDASGK